MDDVKIETSKTLTLTLPSDPTSNIVSVKLYHEFGNLVSGPTNATRASAGVYTITYGQQASGIYVLNSAGRYRIDFTYKLSVVKNRDADKSILARVKWQYKYKGEYRKPAYIGVYIGSLKDFPKGLEENNIDEVAKSKIEEYFMNKIPVILQDINGNEYQL